jgi:hypothetical protein
VHKKKQTGAARAPIVVTTGLCCWRESRCCRARDQKNSQVVDILKFWASLARAVDRTSLPSLATILRCSIPKGSYFHHEPIRWYKVHGACYIVPNVTSLQDTSCYYRPDLYRPKAVGLELSSSGYDHSSQGRRTFRGFP